MHLGGRGPLFLKSWAHGCQLIGGMSRSYKGAYQGPGASALGVRVQGFRGSGVQGFRGSGVQGFRGSGFRRRLGSETGTF